MPATARNTPVDTSFATTLREAIERRGLGLGRIAARLEEAGTPVSTATLSYWQSGRSRPGRQTSMSCLASLERILRLEPGTLAGQLGRPAARGRHQAPPSWASLWTEVPHVAAAFDLVDTSDEDHLTRISYHDTIYVGPDRTERRTRIQQIMRCERDGVDRFVVMHGIDEPDCALPEIHPLVRCEVSRLTTDPGSGVVTAEMLLPRPLRRGELVEVAYEVRLNPPYPSADRYERRRRFPNRQYVLEVRFDAAALPVSSVGYITPFDGETSTQELVLDPDENSLLMVELDGRPGVVGARWEWPQDQGTEAAPHTSV